MELSLKRQSWLLKVARYGGLDDDRCRTDLCSLFWGVVWGAIRAPFWVALLAPIGSVFGAVLLLYPVIGIIAYFSEGLTPEGWALVGLILWSVALVASAFILFMITKPGEVVSDAVATSKNFVRAGYRSWKDRTCVLVDIR